MRKNLIIAAAALALAGAAFFAGRSTGGEPRPSTYVDTTYGFSIEAPRFEEVAKGAGGMVAMFTAPVENANAFSPNVNVIVDRMPLPANYRETNLALLKKAGGQAASDKAMKVSGLDAVLFEYEGTMGGRALHFLGAYVPAGERNFTVTGTAPKEDFAKYEAAFRACIDSLKIEDAAPAAASAQAKRTGTALVAAIIKTTRMAELAEFYRAGLELAKPESYGSDHLGMRAGAVDLGFDLVKERPASADAVSLWFAVDDLQATFDRFVKLGAKPKFAPTKKPWGDTLAAVFDPDGNVVGLSQRR